LSSFGTTFSPEIIESSLEDTISGKFPIINYILLEKLQYFPNKLDIDTQWNHQITTYFRQKVSL